MSFTPSFSVRFPSKVVSNKIAAIVIGAVLLSSCSGGPGNEEDLSKALNREDTFTTQQADCIAKKVFEEYGEDSDAIEALDKAVDIDELQEGENAVDGFAENFETYIADCTE